jgi:hypothetical protein
MQEIDNSLDFNEEMKKHFKNLVERLEAEGRDLSEEPVLYKWEYPDDPSAHFQLLVVRVSPEDEAMMQSNKETQH